MRLLAFSVFDSKAKYFYPPQLFQSEEECIDVLRRILISVPDHSLSKYPAEHILFSVGSFDDATGVFESTSPLHVTLLSQLVSTPSPAEPAVAGDSPSPFNAAVATSSLMKLTGLDADEAASVIKEIS